MLSNILARPVAFAVVFVALQETDFHVEEGSNGSDPVTVQICLKLTRAKEEILRPITVFAFSEDEDSSATGELVRSIMYVELQACINCSLSMIIVSGIFIRGKDYKLPVVL